MAIIYNSGRRIQGTSTDVAVIDSRGTVDTSTVSGQTIITFTGNGTFTPTSSFNVEYLVVAGGGAGGSSYGGGGGAGGLRTNRSGATNGGGSTLGSTYGVTAQNYNITVGAGGVAPTSDSQQGNDGSNSSIVPTSGTSIISNGGGGGSRHANAGTAGGSSGGSGYAVNGVASLTSPTVQGYASGRGGDGDTYGYCGGGGGGASEVGQGSATQATKTGLDGGDGLQNTISGAATTPYYAGGGAGSGGSANQDLTTRGDGGLGGGGNGGISGDMYGNDATGYGSGGGGTPNNASGYNRGAGSTGIVIIRFATSGNTYETSLGGKPTNVQVGSRYEETDTRKMYHYNQATEVQQLVNGSSEGIANGDTEGGINLNTGSALIGISVSKISFHLKMTVNPVTENLVYCRLYRSGSFVHTFGTTDPDNITVGSYGWYSFGTGGDADAGNGSVTLQDGDHILLSWNRGGSYNDTAMYIELSSSSVYDGTLTNHIEHHGDGSWEERTKDTMFKIVGTGFPKTWSEEGT